MYKYDFIVLPTTRKESMHQGTVYRALNCTLLLRDDCIAYTSVIPGHNLPGIASQLATVFSRL